MANGKEKQTNDPTLPLWRVTYNYVVKYQLRTGTYIIPAATAAEAKDRAEEILITKFSDSGPYKVLSAKPF